MGAWTATRESHKCSSMILGAGIKFSNTPKCTSTSTAFYPQRRSGIAWLSPRTISAFAHDCQGDSAQREISSGAQKTITVGYRTRVLEYPHNINDGCRRDWPVTQGKIRCAEWKMKKKKRVLGGACYWWEGSKSPCSLLSEAKNDFNSVSTV